MVQGSITNRQAEISQHHLNPKSLRGRATMCATRNSNAASNDLPSGLIERRIKIADVELTVSVQNSGSFRLDDS
eukprot:666519-Rhodomonas_salina.2